MRGLTSACPNAALGPAPDARCSVYGLYCDYVLKNPFHEVDQVIKSELFDLGLVDAVTALNRRWAAP